MDSRPKQENRKFTSQRVEDTVQEVKSSIKDKELAVLFENCFPNTLDTTVNFNLIDGRPDTFVITGDINAMWLRDSTAQVTPYLTFINEDDKLKQMIAGVINRQTTCINADPYANAFSDSDKESQWHDDLTEMKPGVYERKWEIDSLCYAVRLAYNYWKISGDVSCFDADWKCAAKLIVRTFQQQQRKFGLSAYKFGRVTAWSTDTVPGNGYGNPVKPVGLIASIFRPSDDATILPFLIPANFFAVTSLRQLAEIYKTAFSNDEFVSECLLLANEVESALATYAKGEHLGYGEVYAYEVDGYGNELFMDDANIPSLLSLPYLGCNIEDEVYSNTRRFLLSEDNPYFFKGRVAEGIGSPHTLVNRIWHLSITMRALTSSSGEEIAYCLKLLKNTHAGKGFMHESFDKNNAADFTRSWFAWANSLFGELILKLYNEKPELL